MKFKAKIATALAMDSNNSKFRQYTSPYYCYFSRTRMFLPRENGKIQEKTFINQDRIIDKTKYTLIRLDKFDDIEEWTKNSKFQAEISPTLKINLVLDIPNGIKLRIIHQRYWIQKNWDWFVKLVIAILFGALVSLYSSKIGYRQGYQDGLKDKSPAIQLPSQPQRH